MLSPHAVDDDNLGYFDGTFFRLDPRRDWEAEETQGTQHGEQQPGR